MLATSKEGGKILGGTLGKALTGAAGILLLVGILRETFYLIKVGQRGVLMRGGMPVRKKNGELSYRISKVCLVLRLYVLTFIFLSFADWRKREQVGIYKVKRPGVKIKFPGWYGVDKVNVQRRIQKLAAFEADCADGQQRHFEIDLDSKVPCDDDGPEYHDSPAFVVINSSESDEVFESFAGAALLEAMERVPFELCRDRTTLNDYVRAAAEDDFNRVGYWLKGVNVRSRALTPIQKAINGFAPQSTVGDSPQPQSAEEDSNVFPLPHPMVVATAELGLNRSQPS